MFSIKKDLSLKQNRKYSRFSYPQKSPILFINKLGYFSFSKIPMKIKNISRTGLFAKVEGKFSEGENLLLEFDGYLSESIPAEVARWDPEKKVIALKFNRTIKIIECIKLNILDD